MRTHFLHGDRLNPALVGLRLLFLMIALLAVSESVDGRVLLLRTPVPFPEVTSIQLVLNAPALINND